MLTEKQKAVPGIVSRWEQMPKSYRNIYEKALRGKSKAAAIKAHCLECAGWRPTEVARCTSLGCPLFPYRPYKGKQ